MNKVFICRQLMLDTRAARMALLTFHCSQSKIHMACTCERLITWLLVGKISYTPKVGHGRLAVNKSVLLQFFQETSFRWSHFLYYSAFWKPAIILEI